MPKEKKRNTDILGNTHPCYKFLVLAFLIAFGLILISVLSGCKTIEETRPYQSMRWSHYGSRITDIMHCTRAVQFGSEEALYSNLPPQWHLENQNIRNCKNRAMNSQEPKQLLSPVGSNSPVGDSQPPSENPAAALPLGTL